MTAHEEVLWEPVKREPGIEEGSLMVRQGELLRVAVSHGETWGCNPTSLVVRVNLLGLQLSLISSRWVWRELEGMFLTRCTHWLGLMVSLQIACGMAYLISILTPLHSCLHLTVSPTVTVMTALMVCLAQVSLPASLSYTVQPSASVALVSPSHTSPQDLTFLRNPPLFFPLM